MDIQLSTTNQTIVDGLKKPNNDIETLYNISCIYNTLIKERNTSSTKVSVAILDEFEELYKSYINIEKIITEYRTHLIVPGLGTIIKYIDDNILKINVGDAIPTNVVTQYNDYMGQLREKSDDLQTLYEKIRAAIASYKSKIEYAFSGANAANILSLIKPSPNIIDFVEVEKYEENIHDVGDYMTELYHLRFDAASIQEYKTAGNSHKQDIENLCAAEQPKLRTKYEIDNLYNKKELIDVKLFAGLLSSKVDDALIVELSKLMASFPGTGSIMSSIYSMFSRGRVATGGMPLATSSSTAISLKTSSKNARFPKGNKINYGENKNDVVHYRDYNALMQNQFLDVEIVTSSTQCSGFYGLGSYKFVPRASRVRLDIDYTHSILNALEIIKVCKVTSDLLVNNFAHQQSANTVLSKLKPSNVITNRSNTIVFEISETFTNSIKIKDLNVTKSMAVNQHLRTFLSSTYYDLAQMITVNRFDVLLTDDLLQMITWSGDEVGSIDVIHRRIVDVAYAVISTYIHLLNGKLETAIPGAIQLTILEVPAMLNILDPSCFVIPIMYTITDSNELMLYYNSFSSRVLSSKYAEHSITGLPSFENDKLLYNTCKVRLMDDNNFISPSLLYILSISNMAVPPKKIDLFFTPPTDQKVIQMATILSLTSSYFPAEHLLGGDTYARHDWCTAILQKSLPLTVGPNGGMLDEDDLSNGCKRRMYTITGMGCVRDHFDTILQQITNLHGLGYSDHVGNMLLILGGKASHVNVNYCNEYCWIINIMKVAMTTIACIDDHMVSLLHSIALDQHVIKILDNTPQEIEILTNKNHSRQESHTFSTMIEETWDMKKILENALREKNTSSTLRSLIPYKRIRFDIEDKTSSSQKMHPIEIGDIIKSLLVEFKPPKVGIQSYYENDTFDFLLFNAWYQQFVVKLEYMFLKFGAVKSSSVAKDNKLKELMILLEGMCHHVFLSLYMNENVNYSDIVNNCIFAKYPELYSIGTVQTDLKEPSVGLVSSFATVQSSASTEINSAFFYNVLEESLSKYDKVITEKLVPVEEISKMKGVPQLKIEKNLQYSVNSYSQSSGSNNLLTCPHSYYIGGFSNLQIETLMILFSKRLDFILSQSWIYDYFKITFLLYMNRRSFYTLTSLASLEVPVKAMYPLYQGIAELVDNLLVSYFKNKFIENRDILSLMIYSHACSIYTADEDIEELVQSYTGTTTGFSKFKTLKRVSKLIGEITAHRDIFNTLLDSKLIGDISTMTGIMANIHAFSLITNGVIYNLYHKYKSRCMNFHEVTNDDEEKEVTASSWNDIMKNVYSHFHINSTSSLQSSINAPQIEQVVIKLQQYVVNLNIYDHYYNILLFELKNLNILTEINVLLSRETIIKGISTFMQQLFEPTIQCLTSSNAMIHRIMCIQMGKLGENKDMWDTKLDKGVHNFTKYFVFAKNYIQSNDTLLKHSMISNPIHLRLYHTLSTTQTTWQDIVTSSFNDENYKSVARSLIGLPATKSKMDDVLNNLDDYLGSSKSTSKFDGWVPRGSPQIDKASQMTNKLKELLVKFMDIYKGSSKDFGDTLAKPEGAEAFLQLTNELKTYLTRDNSYNSNWSSLMSDKLDRVISTHDKSNPSALLHNMDPILKSLKNGFNSPDSQSVLQVVDLTLNQIQNDYTFAMNRITGFISLIIKDKTELTKALDKIDVLMKSGVNTDSITENISTVVAGYTSNLAFEAPLRVLYSSIINPFELKYLKDHIRENIARVFGASPESLITDKVLESIVIGIFKSFKMGASSYPESLVQELYTAYHQDQIQDREVLKVLRSDLQEILGSYGTKTQDNHQKQMTQIERIQKHYLPRGVSLPAESNAVKQSNPQQLLYRVLRKYHDYGLEFSGDTSRMLQQSVSNLVDSQDAIHRMELGKAASTFHLPS